MAEEPKDELFGKRDGKKAESFAKAHKKGGEMHKRGRREKMSEHKKEAHRR